MTLIQRMHLCCAVAFIARRVAGSLALEVESASCQDSLSYQADHAIVHVSSSDAAIHFIAPLKPH